MVFIQYYTLQDQTHTITNPEDTRPGHPKIHKPPHYPLREIVDSTGSVTKNIDKHIAGILKTYIKNTDHYIKNSKDFVDKCKNINVAED